MTVKLWGTLLRLHPLALLFWGAAFMLGSAEDAATLLAALTVHESAHLLAARCLGARVRQLRLMPFGGAITMDNPYALAPSMLLVIAAAGPVGNLLALLTCAALTHWELLGPVFALALLKANFTLMLFNLLPALPLDGGRMLYALLFTRFGRERAAELGIRIGRGVAAALTGLAACSAFFPGRLNLSPMFAAVFILASARDEREALGGIRLNTVLSELRPLTHPTPARIVAVNSACDLQSALRAARPDALTLYAVYEESRLTGFTDDRQLLETMVSQGVRAPVSKAV